MLTLSEILQRLRSGDESVDIEAKSAREVGNSLQETICAFSNEPGLVGGYIACGVALKPGALFYDYEVIGVPDAAKLQHDLTSICRDAFNVALRPQIRIERHTNGKDVLIIFVPEVVPGQKPVYLRSKGLPDGAFRRIAASDQRCTEDDIALLYQGRQGQSYEATAVVGSSLADFSPEALIEYRRLRREIKADAVEIGYSDQDLLYALGATTRHEGQLVASVAGLVLFGTDAALRRYFPLLRVDYILVEGREWVANPDERFQTIETRGPLILLIGRIVNQILADIPNAFTLASDGIHRKEVPRLPRLVIREAVVNALIHRSYRQRHPVQIIRYTNRLEIRNPGSSLKADDRLGEPGSVARNECIAAAIHEVGLAETKGSGIRAMQTAMVDAGLTTPFFESDRSEDRFVATLLMHHLLSESDIAWLSRLRYLGQLDDEDARILVTVRETGAITNARSRSLTGRDTLTTSKQLQRLRDLGLLQQRGSGAATYYIAGERLRDALSSLDSVDNSLDNVGSSLDNEGNSLDNLLEGAPESLKIRLLSLKGRVQPEDMKNLIISLCAWRELSLPQIAYLTKRQAIYIATNYLRPMLKSGEVTFVYPDEPNHPRQAYRARSN